MKYGDVEELWLKRLQAGAYFDNGNSSRGRWGILNKGRSPHYAVLKPGEHSRQMITFSMRQNNWQTIIQVFYKYTDDGDSLTGLQKVVDNILTDIDKWPHLNDDGGTVVDAEIVSVREVIQSPADAPSWLYVELVGQTDEQEVVTFSE